jgi:hypothetical protein
MRCCEKISASGADGRNERKETIHCPSEAAGSASKEIARSGFQSISQLKVFKYKKLAAFRT